MSEYSLKEALGPRSLEAAKQTKWWSWAAALAEISYGLVVTGTDVGRKRNEGEDAYMHIRLKSIDAMPGLTEESWRGLFTDMAHEFEKRAIFEATR